MGSIRKYSEVSGGGHLRSLIQLCPWLVATACVNPLIILVLSFLTCKMMVLNYMMCKAPSSSKFLILIHHYSHRDASFFLYVCIAHTCVCTCAPTCFLSLPSHHLCLLLSLPLYFSLFFFFGILLCSLSKTYTQAKRYGLQEVTKGAWTVLLYSMLFSGWIWLCWMKKAFSIPPPCLVVMKIKIYPLS